MKTTRLGLVALVLGVLTVSGIASSGAEAPEEPRPTGCSSGSLDIYGGPAYATPQEAIEATLTALAPSLEANSKDYDYKLVPVSQAVVTAADADTVTYSVGPVLSFVLREAKDGFVVERVDQTDACPKA